MSKVGSFVIISGCMFSGKTDELQRRIRRAKIAGRKVQVFKPDIDFRYSLIKVVTHYRRSLRARPIKADHPEELLHYLKKGTQIVYIDELQFFGPKITDVIKKLNKDGVDVVGAGLNQDFKGDPFGPMAELLWRADHVDSLDAVCNVCGERATRTQRLINGLPAPRSAPVILIGSTEVYQARCPDHHEVPD